MFSFNPDEGNEDDGNEDDGNEDDGNEMTGAFISPHITVRSRLTALPIVLVVCSCRRKPCHTF